MLHTLSSTLAVTFVTLSWLAFRLPLTIPTVSQFPGLVNPKPYDIRHTTHANTLLTPASTQQTPTVPNSQRLPPNSPRLSPATVNDSRQGVPNSPGLSKQFAHYNYRTVGAGDSCKRKYPPAHNVSYVRNTKGNACSYEHLFARTVTDCSPTGGMPRQAALEAHYNCNVGFHSFAVCGLECSAVSLPVPPVTNPNVVRGGSPSP